MIPRPMPLLIVAIVAIVAMPAHLRGQERELARVDTLLARGETAEARVVFDAWWEKRGASLGPAVAVRPRALLLRARLATEPGAAERDLRTIALEHPASAEAPEALLRWGQLLLARGDAARASLYLMRLTTDHAGSPQAPPGALWLARAWIAAGEKRAACTGSEAALAAPSSDPELTRLLEAERARACGTADADSRQSPASREPEAAAGASPRRDPATTPRRAGEAPAPATTAAPAAGSGRFAVQSGAFREPAGARTVAERVRRAGLEPRIVRVGTGTLLRVRAGRFATRAEAAAAVATLRGAGIEAMIVDDVASEVLVPPR